LTVKYYHVPGSINIIILGKSKKENMEALRSIPTAEGYERDIDIETLWFCCQGQVHGETKWQKEVHFVRVPMID
jgi:hypothetical protein